MVDHLRQATPDRQASDKPRWKLPCYVLDVQVGLHRSVVPLYSAIGMLPGRAS